MAHLEIIPSHPCPIKEMFKSANAHIKQMELWDCNTLEATAVFTHVFKP